MKTVNKCAAQGDLLIRRVDGIPASARPAIAKDGKFIVAHSETGHHHVVAERPGIEYYDTDDPLVSYMRVIENVEIVLEHERSFDKHESLLMKGGTYEIRRQREYVPEGWRRVAD